MSSILNSTFGRLLVAGVVILGAIIAWILISPLFINNTVQEEAVSPQATISHNGSFMDADRAHQGSGAVSVQVNTDGTRTLRFEDFEGTNGPDLFVWLTSVDDVQGNRRSVGGDAVVDLGRLKGNVGSQNYEIPADVDLSEFDTVIVWCRAFGVLFSFAELSLAEV